VKTDKSTCNVNRETETIELPGKQMGCRET